MKKNLKKLLSLLTALTIIFTMAGIPAMAEEVTVDFTAAENIAYGKVVTGLCAGSWYSSGSPSASNMLITDGSLDTMIYSDGDGSKTPVKGVKFSIDLGAEYNLENVKLYGSNTNVKIYSGALTPDANDSYILKDAAGVAQTEITATTLGEATTINGVADLKVASADLTGTTARYLTFAYTSKYTYQAMELYITGTPVTTGGGTTEPEEPGTGGGTTEPETPVVPTKTIDFSEAANIAYGKTITHIGGHYYSNSTPSDTKQFATDGDITTNHSGYGKVNGSTVGVTFSLDLGKTYKLTGVDLYLANVGEANRTYKLYKGTAVDEANLIADVPASNTTAIVNGTEVAANSFAITGDVETQYITFYYPEGYGFTYSELYITGTEVTSSGGGSEEGGDGGESGDGGTTEPSEPETPTGTTVDFTAATNVAYQKVITPKAGRDYYATSSTKPSATSQLATDGDITTWHMAAGRTNLTWGTTVGCEFNLDLGGNKKITSIDMYIQVEGIYTNPGNTGNLRTFPNETINVYGGADATTGTLIGTMTKPADSTDYKSITAGGKTMDMYVYHIDFPADAEYSTITFENGTKYNWAYNEIYVTGTEGTTGGGTTEPEEPEAPEIPTGDTIDFTAAENIAYGKTITPVAGAYYSSGPKPSATNQKATDGDVTTKHSGYGRATTSSSSAKTGVIFYVDLGKTYKLNQLALYIGQTDRGYSIYKGTAVDESNYIGSVSAAGAKTTVNGTELGKTTFDFGDDVETRYLTFNYGGGSGFTYCEMYITGTEVAAPTPDYAALVAGDKAALDLGDTSAVEANLTLPTVGSVNGSTITWATSDAAVITNTGVITRAAEDKTATLTATITNGDATDTKTFTVTVVKKETKTVNFKTAKNLAYGKTITPKAGRDKYVTANGLTAPSSSSQLGTDGDITTYHMAAGRNNVSWGTNNGSEFSIDLGKNRNITSVDWYVQPTMHDGSMNRSNKSLTINVYGGADATTGTLIGAMTIPAATTVVNGLEVCIYHIDFPANAEYSAITFEATAWYCGYNEIYVTYEMTDEDYIELVAKDKAALDLGNTSLVISDLTLPSVGANESTITWATSDPDVVAADGTVVRGSENQTVTLTATITNGTATDTKTFEITVLGTDTDDGKVASDKAALQLGDTSAVTENLTLPTVGANGSTITWRTNNPAVVEADGTVHRDLDSKRATLTATITNGTATDTKQFVVTVLGTVTDEERVASDKETLSLGDTTAVKAYLILPQTGAMGSTITWATSDASVITKDGVVTRGDADKTATLTATIKYGNVTDTKVFIVTVLKKVVVSGFVDFDAAENIAYGKIATPVSGRNYYAKSAVAPDEENRYTTDGDLTTYHQGAGRTGVSWGTKVGSEFTIDLGETYTIESVDLFAQPIMNDGSTDRSNASIKIYVYGDGNKDTGALVGQMIIPAATTIVSDGVNEMEMYIYHIDVPANSHYSTLSFYADITYYWGWNEVYVKGESSFAANVVDDKKSIEFGDLNDVVESLTLPLAGAKGSTITWATTDASVIETDGTVHRAEHTKKAKLTATITKGDVSDTKEFYVTVLGTYDNHYVINSDDFNDSNIRSKYVSNVATDSTAAVNTNNNKLELTRNAAGEISVKKYLVTERSDVPYSVIGDKVVMEQLMAVSDGLQGATAEIRNKNDELIATYGIKEEGGDYVFFLNVGGREQSIIYTYGDEIFTRVELVTENGTSSVKAIVGTEYGVDTVAELPLAASVHPSMTTVEYKADEGSNGKLILDGVKFMLEGADKDKIAVVIETENFKDSHITTQNFDSITGNLSLKTSSIFDCEYSYESDNHDVLSAEGFVTRPLEDTPVILTVTIKRGDFSKNLTFNLLVKGLAADNMAMDNLILSSGAVEGSSDKNAVDGLRETAFVTDATEKFFAICFNKATTFNIVTLFEAKNESDEYGVTGFTIDVSDNGVDWETVYTGTTVGEQKTVEFPQVTTKYVRYYVTELTGTETGLCELVITYDPVPEVAIQLDLEKIVINPNNYIVTTDLELPTVGEYGSVITWKSSHPEIVGHDGTLVSVPEKDTVIKLTATLTNGDFTKSKDFTRSVKGSSNGETDEETGKTEKPGAVTGGGGGGSDDEEDPNPPVDPTPVVPTPSAGGFKDVASDRWSYSYIMELKEAGIVSGDGENFRPTDKVTREEFVKMLVLSLGITPEGTADFSDVASDAWYHDYVAVAVEKGIVNGISDSEFGIGRAISRQDMAVMTVRALTAFEVELQGGEAPTFTDGDEIADYATEAVETLAAAGILSGSDGKFAPTDNLTREQAAKVLCMIRKELTK